MARSKSSHQWMQRHVNDEFVKRAQKDGYRSRASYKLLELQEKDRLIKPGQVIVDLGSAPGSWSQVAVKLVGGKGRVLATDILEMDGILGVEFIQGDFRETEFITNLLQMLGESQVDLVISDMAPNISGVAAMDQPRSIHLCELALDFARQVLKPGGVFVSKVFHGAGFDLFVKEVRSSFTKVAMRKPKASRSDSREVYMVASGFKSC